MLRLALVSCWFDIWLVIVASSASAISISTFGIGVVVIALVNPRTQLISPRGKSSAVLIGFGGEVVAAGTWTGVGWAWTAAVTIGAGGDVAVAAGATANPESRIRPSRAVIHLRKSAISFSLFCEN